MSTIFIYFTADNFLFLQVLELGPSIPLSRKGSSNLLIYCDYSALFLVVNR